MTEDGNTAARVITVPWTPASHFCKREIVMRFLCRCIVGPVAEGQIVAESRQMLRDRAPDTLGPRR